MLEIDIDMLDASYEKFKKNGGYIFISPIQDNGKIEEQVDIASRINNNLVISMLEIRTQMWVHRVLSNMRKVEKK